MAFRSKADEIKYQSRMAGIQRQNDALQTAAGIENLRRKTEKEAVSARRESQLNHNRAEKNARVAVVHKAKASSARAHNAMEHRRADLAVQQNAELIREMASQNGKHQKRKTELERERDEAKNAQKQAEAERDQAREERDDLQKKLDHTQSLLDTANATIADLQEKLGMQKKKEELAGIANGVPTNKTPIGQDKVIPATKRGKGKKRGGQEGSPRHMVSRVQNPDEKETVPHDPDSSICKCGCEMKAVDQKTKYETDIVIRVIERTHTFAVLRCPECGRERVVKIPDSLKEKVNYGPDLKVLILYLYIFGIISMKRTAEIVGGLTLGRIEPCPGYVAKLVRKFGTALRSFREDLRIMLLLQKVVYWDDTVADQDTERGCLRFIGSEKIACYFGHAHKDNYGLFADGVLQYMSGDQHCMHDHNKSNYDDRLDFKNQECLVHLERGLLKVQHFYLQSWGGRCRKIISTVIEEAKELKKRGEKRFSDERIAQLMADLDRVIAEAEEEVAADLSPYHEKAVNTLNLIRDFRTEFFRWVYDFDLDWSNNLSERSLRLTKIRLSISGQFYSAETTDIYACLLTYVQTCQKNGISAFEALRRLVQGNPVTVEELFGRSAEFDRLKITVEAAEKDKNEKYREEAEKLDLTQYTPEELKKEEIDKIIRKIDQKLGEDTFAASEKDVPSYAEGDSLTEKQLRKISQAAAIRAASVQIGLRLQKYRDDRLHEVRKAERKAEKAKYYEFGDEEELPQAAGSGPG